MTQARLLFAVIVLLLARRAPACGTPAAGAPLDGLCAVVAGRCTRPPLVGVLSAFPYEQQTLRTQATITEQVEIGGRPFLVGRLAGQRVVMALTGIGLVNAAATTRAMLDHFDVSTLVFSGVAGSVDEHIGDVLVPATWTYSSAAGAFAADAALLAQAQAIAATAPTLGRCTPVPLDPPGPETCFVHVPRVSVGGVGASADLFNGAAYPCVPGSTDVSGCDVGAAGFGAAGAVATASIGAPGVTVAVGPAGAVATVSIDMESAAVAEVASGRGVPFVIVRGVSDGAGDPLPLLHPFPFNQFFDYYRVAADNAAVVTTGLLEGLPDAPQTRSRHAQPRPTAACAFERAAGADCADASASRGVARLVARGCALRARAVEDGVSHPDRLLRKAAARWRRAAALAEHGRLPSCCAAALGARLRAAADLPAS